MKIITIYLILFTFSNLISEEKKEVKIKAEAKVFPRQRNWFIQEEKDKNMDLIKAIYSGKTEDVKDALKEGAELEFKYEGWTPLMIAAALERVEIVKILIEKGANKNAELNSGWTVLSIAEASKSRESSEVLRKRGAIRKRDESGLVPGIPKLKVVYEY